MATEFNARKSLLPSIALTLILFFSFAMIGAATFLKYKMDQGQNLLAAPDSAFSSDEKTYEKTILALGYSGFLGSAQNYISSGDQNALADMRMSYKTARETLTPLANDAAGPVHRDIKAILDIFAGLIAKAEQSDAMSEGLTSADLLRASSALAVLDVRLQTAMARERLTAHNDLKLWSLGLTLLAWMAAIFLAGLAFTTFLMLRTRQESLLDTLTQSVKNITQNDPQASVWGIERTDAVGDLARAIDSTRRHFVNLPDIAVESDEGTVSFRFQGEQRSAFDTLMEKIGSHYERAEQSAHIFTKSMDTQKDMIGAVTGRLNLTLDALRQQETAQRETIRDLAQTLRDTSYALNQAQRDSVDQVAHMLPMLQERARTMGEVTQLAGRQVGESLQSLLKAEGALRASATYSQEVMNQLANATNKMGERLFASVNLIQATGKTFTDTTNDMKSRFNEGIATLARGETNLQHIISRAENRLASTINAEENMAALAARTESSAQKMERAVADICERHEGLSEQVITATHRMDSIVASFDAAQRAMSEATNQVRRDGTMISNLLTELRTNNDHLLASVHQNSQANFSTVQTLAEKSHALMQRLEVQIQQQSQTAEARIDELSSYSKTIAHQTTATGTSLTQAVANLKTEQDKMAAARSRFVDLLTDLGTRFEQQATSVFGKTEHWAAQNFAKLGAIAEQVEAVMQRLGMLGQLTSTLGSVAGQLGQIVPALASGMPVAAGGAPVTVDMEDTKALIVKQARDMLATLQSQWNESVVQIEAMHDQLAQIVVQQKDQLETRLVVMDKKIREATEEIKSLHTESEADERKADILNELIAAMGKINEHVMALDTAIEDAGLKKEAS